MFNLFGLLLGITTISLIDAKEDTNLLLRQSHARIINGYKASKKQFPFHVSIEYSVEDGYFLNGGSILSERYILTTAHSFVDRS